ncbi:hypothetical protein [Herbihabitans rhizosphaerae]|uniref:hypothetical protein n=1 Tax=Herbihabitans rhizosphaerae TaxID=1872711 RepID=UPI001A9187A7|nr:hypothetical protein [Herbihabitans rhizosphaerae]
MRRLLFSVAALGVLAGCSADAGAQVSDVGGAPRPVAGAVSTMAAPPPTLVPPPAVPLTQPPPTTTRPSTKTVTATPSTITPPPPAPKPQPNISLVVTKRAPMGDPACFQGCVSAQVVMRDFLPNTRHTVTCHVTVHAPISESMDLTTDANGGYRGELGCVVVGATTFDMWATTGEFESNHIRS